jgi:hypothetical protein
MAEEDPFLAGQRPWERADILAAGTPQIPFDPASELVVAPPLTRQQSRTGTEISPVESS